MAAVSSTLAPKRERMRNEFMSCMSLWCMIAGMCGERARVDTSKVAWLLMLKLSQLLDHEVQV
jgi:hypothetical protein